MARKKKPKDKKPRDKKPRDKKKQPVGDAPVVAAPPTESPPAVSTPFDAPPVEESTAESTTPVDDAAIVDLDADLGEDLEDDLEGDALALLIAETAGAPTPSDRAEEDEAPLIDLDAELEPVDRELAQREAPGASPTEPAVLASADGPEHASDDVPGTASADQPQPALPDLRAVSSQKLRDRLLAEALAHAEHQDARYRVPFADRRASNRWKAAIVTVLAMTAIGLAVAPPAWVVPDGPLPLMQGERVRNVRVALLLQAQQVEAFRVRTQRLPSSLDEVSSRFPGIRYVRSGNRAYQLIAYDRDGTTVVYDSLDPAPPFGTIAPPWLDSERRR